jgi:hypothetical protein
MKDLNVSTHTRQRIGQSNVPSLQLNLKNYRCGSGIRSDPNGPAGAQMGETTRDAPSGASGHRRRTPLGAPP